MMEPNSPHQNTCIWKQ